MPQSNLNIVIVGVGGQGTVLASKLLATCALSAGAEVRSAETIGMAQRGGSVLGHVRIGVSNAADGFANPETGTAANPKTAGGTIQSPLVPLNNADLIIGFEPSETVKALPYLRTGGMVVSSTTALAPPTASLQRLNYDGSAQVQYLQKLKNAGIVRKLVLVNGQAATGQLGSLKVLNTALLGAALQALDNSLFCAEALKATMAEVVKPQFLELNIRALEYGIFCATQE